VHGLVLQQARRRKNDAANGPAVFTVNLQHAPCLLTGRKR
jgi:hypothetical protein